MMHVRPFRNLYVHVPFCRGKCDYCAFYSEPCADADDVSAWLSKLASDAGKYAPDTLPLQTVYIGGGTPTVLSADALERLFALLHEHFRIQDDAEISMECNPESLTPEKAVVLGRYVNRVSMGVQSFSAELRARIGRRSSGAVSLERALGLLHDAGIANTGFDLMYLLPGQTLDDWKRELDTALCYAPRHLSAYSLMIEEGTALAARGLPPEDEELSFAMWDYAQSFLSAHGLPRYEISNYASEAFECRHNQNVWHGESYLGLGPAACSFDGIVRRTEAVPLSAWLAGAEPEPDEIPENRRLAEIFIMGLRTVRGWKKDEFSALCGLSWRDFWSRIIDSRIAEGMLSETDGKIAPSAKGLAFWNDLAMEFL